MGEQLIRTKFECPICFIKLRPPIFLCDKGHTLCGNCLKELTICPFCESTLNNERRNYYLEDLCVNLKYQCKFGCEESSQLAEIEEHEKVCINRNFQCIVPDCTFDNNKLEMIKHIKGQHADRIIYITSKDKYLSFEKLKEKIILTETDMLFKICYTHKHDVRRWNQPKEIHVHSLNLGKQDSFIVRIYQKSEGIKRHISMSVFCHDFNEKCNSNSILNHKIVKLCKFEEAFFYPLNTKNLFYEIKFDYE